MIKNFLMKAALKAQLKNVPAGMRAQLESLIDKHPEFFEKVAKDVEQRIKQGQDKVLATQAAFMAHQAEMRTLMLKQ